MKENSKADNCPRCYCLKYTACTTFLLHPRNGLMHESKRRQRKSSFFPKSMQENSLLITDALWANQAVSVYHTYEAYDDTLLNSYGALTIVCIHPKPC